MHKHHDILLAALSLGLLTAVACDLPPAPVGTDSACTDGETAQDVPNDEGYVLACAGYNPCAGSEDEIGLYSAWICGPNSAQVVIGGTMDCAEALANCLLNETINAVNGTIYHCEWNGFDIHRTLDPEGYCDALHGPPTACEDLGRDSCVVPEDPCEGQEGWQDILITAACSGEATDAPSLEDVGPYSCEDARTVCADFLAANPDLSLSCMWNGKVLLYNEAVAGECESFEPC